MTTLNAPPVVKVLDVHCSECGRDPFVAHPEWKPEQWNGLATVELIRLAGTCPDCGGRLVWATEPV